MLQSAIYFYALFVACAAFGAAPPPAPAAASYPTSEKPIPVVHLKPILDMYKLDDSLVKAYLKLPCDPRSHDTAPLDAKEISTPPFPELTPGETFSDYKSKLLASLRSLRETSGTQSAPAPTRVPHPESSAPGARLSRRGQLTLKNFPSVHTTGELADFRGFLPKYDSWLCGALRHAKDINDKTREDLIKQLPPAEQFYVESYRVADVDRRSDFVKTSNDTGDEVKIQTAYTRKFTDLAVSPDGVGGKIVYDFGSGYGFNVHNVLLASHPDSKLKLIAVDYELSHLQQVVVNAPSDKAHLLWLQFGRLPQLLTSIRLNSVDVALLSHVLHYMTPAEVEKSLNGILRILKPGGVLIIQALSIYAEPYFESKVKTGAGHIGSRVSSPASPGAADEDAAEREPLHHGLLERVERYDSAHRGKTWEQVPHEERWPTFLEDGTHTLPMKHPQYLPALLKYCQSIGFLNEHSGYYNILSGHDVSTSEVGDALGLVLRKPH